MQTQVSILVKNESIVSRFFSFLWFINIFKKMPVDVYIDSENNKQTLKARREPYVFDLEPGQHIIVFADPRAKSKAAFGAVTGALLGGTFNMAAGGSFFGGAADAYSFDGTVRNGCIDFTLQEGDLLKLSAKPKRNGSVKVKKLKK